MTPAIVLAALKQSQSDLDRLIAKLTVLTNHGLSEMAGRTPKALGETVTR
jgi:hypothetical protein